MHARPALLLAQRAREFQADVSLVLVSCPVDISTPAGTRADAKSMLDLMFLQAPSGSELDVEATGPDAEAAVEAIEGLFRDLSLIHISEPTRQPATSRMPSSA